MSTFIDQFKDMDPTNESGYKLFKDSFVTGRDQVSLGKIEFKDAMSTSNSSVWLPRVISEVAREAVEPNLILTNLLDRVEFQPGIQIIFVSNGSAHRSGHCRRSRIP